LATAKVIPECPRVSDVGSTTRFRRSAHSRLSPPSQNTLIDQAASRAFSPPHWL
jgi:hypothetical protein